MMAMVQLFELQTLFTFFCVSAVPYSRSIQKIVLNTKHSTIVTAKMNDAFLRLHLLLITFRCISIDKIHSPFDE